MIEHGQTVEDALPPLQSELGAARDRALAAEICYGVLRWYPRLTFIARQLLQRPLHDRDRDVQALLLGGLYQLDFLRTPDHAAVSASVDAARELNKSWAAPLLNATLRRYQRERERIAARVEEDAEARHAHPAWLLDALIAEWPEHWPAIVAANNERPPLHLRVNLRRATRAEFLDQLAVADLPGDPLPDCAAGVRLQSAVEVEQLPGFAAGSSSVQDAGAQFAAELLDARPGERVLDACAAPGGKSAHILERTPGLGELVAVDRDPSRLARVRQNLDRLQLDAVLQCADAARAGWYDGPAFDRVLIDAPCSATGVIRRHPDIKLLRKPGQIPRYSATQDALLNANWPLLRRGGRLLYSTCSLLRAENDARIEKFRDNNKDVRILAVSESCGTATGLGRQTVPGLADTDGFYYALLEKT